MLKISFGSGFPLPVYEKPGKIFMKKSKLKPQTSETKSFNTCSTTALSSCSNPICFNGDISSPITTNFNPSVAVKINLCKANDF